MKDFWLLRIKSIDKAEDVGYFINELPSLDEQVRYSKKCNLLKRRNYMNLKKGVDIKNEFEELFEFSQDEKTFIMQNIDKFKKDDEYELLKRKFYHELEGFDLEIEIIKYREAKQTKHNRQIIKELKKEKQDLINSIGFIFDYKKEDLK